MATTYAFPVHTTAAHDHHGHGHTRSHHRKAAPERIPLRPTSMNGGYQVPLASLASPPKEPTEGNHYSHMVSQSLPQNSWDNVQKENQQQFQMSAKSPTIGSDLRSPVGMNFDSMDSRIRRMPPNLAPKQDGYNFPSITVPPEVQQRGNWISKPEAIASILLPLPYALASIVFSQMLPQSSQTASNMAQSSLENVTSVNGTMSILQPNALMCCALTSITLLMVGLGGKVRGHSALRDRRKSTLGHASNTHKGLSASVFSTARRILGRMMGVGLPFYAASLLGCAEVAVIMLTVVAGNILKTKEEGLNTTSIAGWKSIFMFRKWTIAVMTLQVIAHAVGFAPSVGLAPAIAGYTALWMSIFLIPFPYITSKPKASIVTSPNPNSSEKTSAVAMTPWEMTPPNITSPDTIAKQSPLTYTSTDINLTLIAGLLLGLFTYTVPLVSSSNPMMLNLRQFGWLAAASAATTMSLTTVETKKLQSRRKMGYAFSLILAVTLPEVLQLHTWTSFIYQFAMVGSFIAATHLDARSSSSTSSHYDHQHHHRHQHENPTVQHGNHSKFTGLLLHTFQNRPLLHSILIERDSRRIFYFMSLNFAFMLVQTFYAIVTGSLGLLSDSIHMLFDCLALVVGLCASVMSKWPPSTRFPYGYGKMDTLAGFANGVFLMLISIEIVYEAIERLAEGSEMQRIGELLTVSSLGLVVNLVGMSAFGHAHHGHGHSHGGHDHSRNGDKHSHDSDEHSHDKHEHSNSSHSHPHSAHSHSCDDHSHPAKTLNHEKHHHDHPHSHHHPSPPDSAFLTSPMTPLPYSIPPTPSKPPPTPAQSHSGHSHHHHGHGNENMHGIFLHILADTLGSVAVVISTILIHYTGWAGFDPLASCLIAILIFASAVPLVTSSAKTLLLTVPEDTEFDLREALAGVSDLRGVSGVTVPRFWMGEGEDGRVGGVMHVQAGKGLELEDVRERAVRYLAGRGMDVLVQVEREGEGRCWCGGGVRSA